MSSSQESNGGGAATGNNNDIVFQYNNEEKTVNGLLVRNVDFDERKTGKGGSGPKADRMTSNVNVRIKNGEDPNVFLEPTLKLWKLHKSKRNPQIQTAEARFNQMTQKLAVNQFFLASHNAIMGWAIKSENGVFTTKAEEQKLTQKKYKILKNPNELEKLINAALHPPTVLLLSSKVREFVWSLDDYQAYERNKLAELQQRASAALGVRYESILKAGCLVVQFCHGLWPKVISFAEAGLIVAELEQHAAYRNRMEANLAEYRETIPWPPPQTDQGGDDEGEGTPPQQPTGGNSAVPQQAAPASNAGSVEEAPPQPPAGVNTGEEETSQRQRIGTASGSTLLPGGSQMEQDTSTGSTACAEPMPEDDDDVPMGPNEDDDDDDEPRYPLEDAEPAPEATRIINTMITTSPMATIPFAEARTQVARSGTRVTSVAHKQFSTMNEDQVRALQSWLDDKEKEYSSAEKVLSTLKSVLKARLEDNDSDQENHTAESLHQTGFPLQPTQEVAATATSLGKRKDRDGDKEGLLQEQSPQERTDGSPVNRKEREHSESQCCVQ